MNLNDIDRLIQYLSTDKDFQKVFNKVQEVNKNIEYKETLTDVIMNCYFGDYNLYLDKTYTDIAWIKINNNIINLDDLFDVYKNYLFDLIESWLFDIENDNNLSSEEIERQTKLLQDVQKCL